MYVHNKTNLWEHLQESHRIESLTSTYGESLKAKTQLTIAEAIHVCQQFPYTSRCWKSLTNSICCFVAKGMQLFQTVNDPSSNNKLLEPRNGWPSQQLRHYFTSSFLFFFLLENKIQIKLAMYSNLAPGYIGSLHTYTDDAQRYCFPRSTGSSSVIPFVRKRNLLCFLRWRKRLGMWLLGVQTVQVDTHTTLTMGRCDEPLQKKYCGENTL